MASLELNPAVLDLEASLVQRLSQVSEGTLTTYGHLARSLGDVRASRWVGQYMVSHDHRPDCACHRVLYADGRIGKYVTGDAAAKQSRLELEGHRVETGRIREYSKCLAHLSGDPPLSKLSELQQRFAMQREMRCASSLRSVAGVDVSYHGDHAIGAYVELDPDQGELIYERCFRQQIRFPYIPTYLAFRELPVLIHLLDVVKQERCLADVIMVDGSGILHPRRGGIATLFGVAANVATIGVTKKRLVGPLPKEDLRPTQPQLIYDDRTGELLGHLMRPSARSSKPIYISPGNRMLPDAALELVQRTLRGRRLPEPIYWADRISRRAVSRLAADASVMP